jgi:DNA mismatch endonuclease (patch repair protein)
VRSPEAGEKAEEARTMTDVFSKQKRSEIMSRVRPRGNQTTEMAFIRLLREAGIKGWRRHTPVVGKPDFVFRSKRLAIFIDGCFWHGCRRCRSIPVDNHDFWEQKLIYNRRRARVVNAALRGKSWRVVRFWEHELKNAKRTREKVMKYLALTVTETRRPRQ